jgi:hypothetical protein
MISVVLTPQARIKIKDSRYCPLAQAVYIHDTTSQIYSLLVWFKLMEEIVT